MTAATGTGKRWDRRLAGILVCSLPILLALVCSVWPRAVAPERVAAGLTLAGAAALLGGWNLYLAFVRPWRYRRRYGAAAAWRHVSGIPLVGTLLLAGGCATAFGSPEVGGLAVLAALVDPDGLPWVPVRTWRDASLWDGSAAAGTGSPHRGAIGADGSTDSRP